jgi:hypothetical protein
MQVTYLVLVIELFGSYILFDKRLNIELKNSLWPRQESNLDLELRKLLYYPLYYGAG